MTETSSGTNDGIFRRNTSTATGKSKQSQPCLSSSPSDSISSLEKPAESKAPHAALYVEEENNKTRKSTRRKKPLSLKERSKSPPSFYISMFLIFATLYFNGFFSHLPQVMDSIQHSITKTSSTFVGLVRHSALILFLGKCEEGAVGDGKVDFAKSYIKVFAMTVLLSCVFYILIYSPLKAGMWTNTQRVKRHKVHRYFGLSFLILYGLAWVQFLNDYDGSYQQSFLPLLIALNGLVQAHSAYFSFKVLPDVDDAGYYSDIAVLSRSFVHENSFYQLMTFFGSVYYGPSMLQFKHLKQEQHLDYASESMWASLSTLISTTIEFTFIFYPYVVFRPFFPTTRFKDAGTGRTGRTERNEKFYALGTTAIKIFYLWSKYFLGFYINFLMFIHFHSGSNGGGGSVTVSYEDMKFIRGLFLLNVGTVSIAVFLHTLRFKKVLPPRLTFSIYLIQIYLTFSAVPYLGHLFFQDYKLLGLVLIGMACNMTRSRKVHAIWCVLCHYLLAHSGIQW